MSAVRGRSWGARKACQTQEAWERLSEGLSAETEGRAEWQGTGSRPGPRQKHAGPWGVLKDVPSWCHHAHWARKVGGARAQGVLKAMVRSTCSGNALKGLKQGLA